MMEFEGADSLFMAFLLPIIASIILFPDLELEEVDVFWTFGIDKSFVSTFFKFFFFTAISAAKSTGLEDSIFYFFN